MRAANYGEMAANGEKRFRNGHLRSVLIYTTLLLLVVQLDQSLLLLHTEAIEQGEHAPVVATTTTNEEARQTELVAGDETATTSEKNEDGEAKKDSTTSDGGAPAIILLPPVVDTDGEPTGDDDDEIIEAPAEGSPHEPTPDNNETPPSSSPSPPTTMPPKKPVECADNYYCLNGGTCVISPTGQMMCICPVGFLGDICQTLDICNTRIADSLTGYQICDKLSGRKCLKHDKFFRCACEEDEYFVFKRLQQPKQQRRPMTIEDYRQLYSQAANSAAESGAKLPTLIDHLTQSSATFAYESDLNQQHRQAGQSSSSSAGGSAQTASAPPSYLAECRKIDKCLGVRCRQMSEVCEAGECVCNRAAGYIKDPSDGICKLLNPCLMPTPDGAPICGEAQCVATYDNDLYKCVCPFGYGAVVKHGPHTNSTICGILTYKICEVPILNKCQHICQIDMTTKGTYKCSCLPGYKSGTRPGIDDHLCFFIEYPQQLASEEYLGQERDLEDDETAAPNRRGSYIYPLPDEPLLADQEYVFRPYVAPSNRQTTVMGGDDGDGDTNDATAATDKKSASSSADQTGKTINYDESESRMPNMFAHGDTFQDELKTGSIHIRREIRTVHRSEARGSTLNGRMADHNNGRNHTSGGRSMLGSKMSAQERCNMYCEENKICVLENGSTNSYRCVCNRQGYVSVGDRCLDWCAAAEFNHYIQFHLHRACPTGACKASGTRPSSSSGSGQSTAHSHSRAANELAELERQSSWRPSFECDCSSSPLLYQDPKTKLCRLDFQAVLAPCLPGNEGYNDCVVNKHAYCAVLHRSQRAFLMGLHKEEEALKLASGSVVDASSADGGRLPPTAKRSGGTSSGAEKSGAGARKAPTAVKEPDYVCVCSPEKKFLVDKPRNKARCVDECGLLNTECGRFNRMCRPATIAPDDFGRGTLVREDREGFRMSFKRTGCECLPGFSLGPSGGIEDADLGDESYNDGDSLNPPFSGIIGGGGIGNNQPTLDKFKYTKYSRCLLDYDVITFHASFKAPPDFNPTWVKVRHTIGPESVVASSNPAQSLSSFQSQQPAAADASHPEPARIGNSRSSPGAAEPLHEAADSRNHHHFEGSSRDTDAASSSASGSSPCDSDGSGCVLKVPEFMRADISELHNSIVLVAQCDFYDQLGAEAYQDCLKYRYWIVQKLRNHFVDWRRVMTNYLSETFDLMEGNIKVGVNKCETTLRSVSDSKEASSALPPPQPAQQSSSTTPQQSLSPIAFIESFDGNQLRTEQAHYSSARLLDPLDQTVRVDADIECELTLHSASDKASAPWLAARNPRKVLLEKQLETFIFNKSAERFGDNYYLMAPNMLIRRESIDQLAEHRKPFNPCKSAYDYCEKQTKCDMVDTVNFTCTCQYGYTPIGSRDIFYGDSRKEVCEDINECLFDVCKEMANRSTCINEIGDYRCQCNRHFTGDNKRVCEHVCHTIPCTHGKCRLIDDHYAFCECDEGYKETDCSVQDPSVALRKANMIIIGSIFTSVLLLAITIGISLNSQLKKTRKKLKRLEAATEAAHLFEFAHQQPFRPRMSKVSSCS